MGPVKLVGYGDAQIFGLVNLIKWLPSKSVYATDRCVGPTYL